jgi:hypothetical protein
LWNQEPNLGYWLLAAGHWRQSSAGSKQQKARSETSETCLPRHLVGAQLVGAKTKARPPSLEKLPTPLKLPSSLIQATPRHVDGTSRRGIPGGRRKSLNPGNLNFSSYKFSKMQMSM